MASPARAQKSDVVTLQRQVAVVVAFQGSASLLKRHASRERRAVLFRSHESRLSRWRRATNPTQPPNSKRDLSRFASIVFDSLKFSIL